jgi:sulfate adenylyltransferase large subunit
LSPTKLDLTPSAETTTPKALLRVSTAGSVDDGKSSLIGRLLYDSKSIFEDQLAAIERASHRRGADGMELALLTDGLRAEREQNITIDVAYRYFATPRRKFILADTPGHEQYTRNMVTGTSTSDVSIVLLDARKGVLPQSKRHAAISALLGIKVIVVAVNKMDLVAFSEARFEEIKQDFLRQTSRLGIDRIKFFPISALLGDNVVEKGDNLHWFHGPTLLHFLETVDVPVTEKLDALRLPIQVVIRPDQDFRGFAGKIQAGSISKGDRVLLLPSQRTAVVAGLHGPNGPVDSAESGLPVVVTLGDHVDLSRGDEIVSELNPPISSGMVEATVCWMHPDPAVPGKRYTILHANRQVSGHILSITNRISIETLEEESADRLEVNDIGRVVLETSRPLHYDPYALCHATGSFVFVDPASSVTLGAGMLLKSGAVSKEADRSVQSLFFKISGGNETERVKCSELIQERFRHQAISLVAASLEELSDTVLADSTDGLSSLIAILERSRVGMIVWENNGEAGAPLTISRFDRELWIETHSWQRDHSLQSFVIEALEDEWSPEI